MSQKPKIPKDFFRAKGKTIVVLPIATEETTKAGLVIMTAENDAVFKQGYIVACGANLTDEVIDFNDKKRVLQIGDKVSYNTYANNTFMYKGVVYLNMYETDVHMLLPENETVLPLETKIKVRKRGVNGQDGKHL